MLIDGVIEEVGRINDMLIDNSIDELGCIIAMLMVCTIVEVGSIDETLLSGKTATVIGATYDVLTFNPVMSPLVITSVTAD
jgi:DNA-directed RNA polymerase subunit E'/Rpb7